MDTGLRRGEGFSWPGDLLAHLPEEVDPCAVFPLQALGANCLRRHPGPPDVPVCGPHQSDGNLTLDVSAHPGVGLPPLCCNAAGYHFKGIHCFHTHYPVNRGEEERKVSALLEACLQLHILLRPFCLLKTLFWCLRRMRLGVCVPNAHVVNTASTIMLEVTDHKVTLLFRGL